MIDTTRKQIPYETQMNIKACIFDMDGLLIDSERIALAVFERTCTHFKVENLIPLYQQLLGTNSVTTRQMLSDALPSSVKVEAFMQFWDKDYSLKTSTAVPLMIGVENLLNYLDSQKILTVVATSTKTDRAIQKLTDSGIAHRFSTIIGGDQISNGKPAPDIYLKAAQFLDIAPEYCLGLEDSPNGVRAALAAGMQVVQIPDIVQPDDTLRKLGHTILENLNAVISHIDLVNQYH